MKIIRLSFVIPTVIAITLVWIFFAFFLDSILKGAAVSVGQAIFGAKVEIGSFKTTFKSFSVNVGNIKIGDKDDEFKNIADIDNINFKVRFIPMLSKKFIIDNMSIDGFKWGTTRKKSAKLPPKIVKKKKEDGFFSKALDGAKSKAQQEFNQFAAVQNFNEIQGLSKNFSLDGAIDFAGIKAVDSIKQTYDELSKKYENYAKEIKGIDIEKQVKDIETLANKISKTNIKTVSDIADLQKDLKTLSEQKDKLEKTFNDLKTLQSGLSKDVKADKDISKTIADLINQDVSDILAKMSIPKLGSNDSIRMLLGQSWVNKINTVVYYMALIRKYMPPKDPAAKKAQEAPLITKGRDITFPLRGILPKLWIGNISISANSGGDGKDENPIFYTGSVKNITSDQRLIGRNTTFEIKSDDKKQVVVISGVFDRLNPIAEDAISFFAEGVSAKMLGIPDSAYSPSFNNAKMRTKADFTLRGSDFLSKISLNIYGLSYDAKALGADALTAKYMTMLWKGVNAMNVDAGFSILEGGSVKADFKSDIDSIFSKKFNEIIKSEIGDIENKVRDEVKKYVESQTKGLGGDAQKYIQDAQKLLDGDIKVSQEALNIVNKLIKDKEGEIKSQSSKAIGSALKGLFK
ncbi:MAG: TIGR03545 family protein [Elusimicrobiota bacterium]|jgi:uncharacterized protein (TIGR03545 family)|nr:TIGR03545 family protein [Elusimicrobiota bacterium]